MWEFGKFLSVAHLSTEEVGLLSNTDDQCGFNVDFLMFFFFFNLTVFLYCYSDTFGLSSFIVDFLSFISFLSYHRCYV